MQFGSKAEDNFIMNLTFPSSKNLETGPHLKLLLKRIEHLSFGIVSSALKGGVDDRVFGISKKAPLCVKMGDRFFVMCRAEA